MRRNTPIFTAVALTMLLMGSAARAQETFTIWSIDDIGSSEQKTWATMVEDFKAAHPDVDVRYETKTFDQLQQTGTMILNSDEAPDITEYNKGNAVAGVAASQGLLTPIDDEVKSRGWDKILNEGDFVVSRYDDKGVFGSGPIYGIAPYGEFVSVFYNVDMFEANGIEVPTTFEEFVAVLDAFKEKGITPLALGASDPQPYLATVVNSQIDQTWFENYQGLKAPLDAAPFLYAAQTLVDWQSKGYIPDDASGLKDDDAKIMFTSGKAPMYFGGTWSLGAFTTSIQTFEWSQFLFPTKQYSTGSTGNMWVVPSGSKNKELAYEFLDMLLQPKYQTLLSNNGAIAIAADPATITNPIGQRQADLFGQISDRNGLGFYLDWPVAGFRETLVQTFTGLLAGSLTPEQYAEEIKAAYDDAQSNQ